MRKSIQTNLLGHAIKLVRHPLTPADIPPDLIDPNNGMAGFIASVYRDEDGTPAYTLALEDGSLVEAYAFHFKLVLKKD